MTKEEFFNSQRPFEIVKTIVHDHELAGDLVSHVYLMIKDREGIRDIEKYFAKFCYLQFKYHKSEFNRLYFPHQTTELMDWHLDTDEEIIHNDDYRQFLKQYIKRETTDPAEWYKTQIAIEVLKGKSRRDIAKATKINTNTIQQTIKQFEHDVLNSYNSHINSTDSNTE